MSKVFCVDIDGVIATITENNQYDLAHPIESVIQAINALYDQGHHIVLFTARGYVTGIDWSATTQAQMQAWGVQYHELKFGKPAADYYIDDKLISIDQFVALASESRPKDEGSKG